MPILQCPRCRAAAPFKELRNARCKACGLEPANTNPHVLDLLDVSVGDRVRKGEIIGLIGKTGRATGPHLCWRLNWFQERLDPHLAAPPMKG